MGAKIDLFSFIWGNTDTLIYLFNVTLMFCMTAGNQGHVKNELKRYWRMKAAYRPELKPQLYSTPQRMTNQLKDWAGGMSCFIMFADNQMTFEIHPRPRLGTKTASCVLLRTLSDRSTDHPSSMCSLMYSQIKTY